MATHKKGGPKKSMVIRRCANRPRAVTLLDRRGEVEDDNAEGDDQHLRQEKEEMSLLSLYTRACLGMKRPKNARTMKTGMKKLWHVRLHTKHVHLNIVVSRGPNRQGPHLYKDHHSFSPKNV